MTKKENQRSHWCGTVNPGHLDGGTELTEADLMTAFRQAWGGVSADSAVRYACGQIEVASTGTLHIQCYIEYTRSQRRSRVKATLNGSHEPRFGTRAQARKYCRKSDSRIEALPEVGIWLAPKELDKDSNPKWRALSLVTQGFTPVEIAVRDPEAFFTHHRAIQELHAALSTDDAESARMRMQYDEAKVAADEEE